nr:retrovirus-related Pol polyprotein from transposon TNT 1-94 [Tanacetum cinerariifolium]
MSRDVLTIGSTMRIPFFIGLNILSGVKGTSSTKQLPLKDKSMWYDQEKKIQKIGRLARSLLIQGLSNDIYSLIDSNKTTKDLWDALVRHMLGSEYGAVNDAMGLKKKTIVVISDPLALLAEKTKVSKRKEKVVVSSYSKGSDADDFSELKKITTLLAKAFNQKKFYSKPTNNNLRTSSASQSANKKQEYVKSDDKKLIRKSETSAKSNVITVKKKKDKDEQVLLAKDHAWMESSSDLDQEINANMVFMAQIEKVLSHLEASSSSADDKISEVSYYLSESESESEYETLKYCDNTTTYGLFVNDNDDQEIFLDCEKFPNNDLLAQTNVLKDQLQVKHGVIDTHVECQEIYTKLKAERYEYMIRYSASFDNDKQHRKQIADQEVLYDKMSVQLVEMDKHVRDLKDTVLEKDFKIFELEECVRNKDLEIEKCLEHLDTLSSVRILKPSGVMWMKNGSSNIVKADFVFDYNNARNALCNTRMNASVDMNDLFVFDDVSSKMPFRKKPSASLNVTSRSKLNKSLPRVMRLPKMKFEKDHLCFVCEQGKIHWKHHKSKTGFASNKPLYLLHMNLCGPMRVESINEKRYVLVVVDDYSRYTWVFFLHSKDVASEVIISFIKKTQVNLQLQVQRVRTDNGAEFKNKTLAKFFDEVGITQQFSAIRTPQKNGVVEKRNRTLVEAARTMLTFANLPLFLWAEAIAIACFTQNCSIIHKHFDKTPYEHMNKINLNIKFFLMFGCRCYLLNDYDDIGKLKAKRDIGVFLGYSKESAVFRIYPNELIMKSSTTNVKTSNVKIHSNEKEVFHESSKSFQEESSSSSLNDDGHQSLEEVKDPSSNTQSVSNNMVPNVDEASTSQNVFNERLKDAYFDASTLFHDPSNVHTFYQPYPHKNKWTKDHPLYKKIGNPKLSVRTRGQLANSCLFSCLLSSIEPVNVAEALRDADWVSAMCWVKFVINPYNLSTASFWS